jgi:archaellum component FlaC
LNGIDVPEDKLKRQLDMIEKELIKLNPPKDNLKKCLQLIKKELKQLETQIATD